MPLCQLDAVAGFAQLVKSQQGCHVEVEQSEQGQQGCEAGVESDAVHLIEDRVSTKQRRVRIIEFSSLLPFNIIEH